MSLYYGHLWELDEQIQQSLSTPPAIDKKVYYRWFVNYSAAKAAAALNASPKTNTATTDLLKSTKYDDPNSLNQLCWAINSPAGLDVFPLGNYTADNKKTFCYLQFIDVLLPRDFLPESTRGEVTLTYLKCQPDNPALPKFFYQLGRLCLSSTATPSSAQPSDWVVVVTPSRRVLAFWNPYGADPEYVQDDDISPTEYQTRPTAGRLPGFATACTAVPLASNIDALCNPDQANRALDIQTSGFVTLPQGSTLRFGGVDAEGWALLDKVSQKFADVPKYPAAGTATA